MFIGDSTNRGVLHYLSQRVNGTLWEWDKTHNLRVYPGLNNNTTFFGFAYYPQFWLPAKHRPVFDKAFYQLIRRFAFFQKFSKIRSWICRCIVSYYCHLLSLKHIDVPICWWLIKTQSQKHKCAFLALKEAIQYLCQMKKWEIIINKYEIWNLWSD